MTLNTSDNERLKSKLRLMRWLGLWRTTWKSSSNSSNKIENSTLLTKRIQPYQNSQTKSKITLKERRNWQTSTWINSFKVEHMTNLSTFFHTASLTATKIQTILMPVRPSVEQGATLPAFQAGPSDSQRNTAITRYLPSNLKLRP